MAVHPIGALLLFVDRDRNKKRRTVNEVYRTRLPEQGTKQKGSSYQLPTPQNFQVQYRGHELFASSQKRDY